MILQPSQHSLAQRILLPILVLSFMFMILIGGIIFYSISASLERHLRDDMAQVINSRLRLPLDNLIDQAKLASTGFTYNKNVQRFLYSAEDAEIHSPQVKQQLRQLKDLYGFRDAFLQVPWDDSHHYSAHGMQKNTLFSSLQKEPQLSLHLVDQELLILILTPVLDQQDRVLGRLGVSIPFSSLTAQLDSDLLGGSARIYITNKIGEILASTTHGMPETTVSHHNLESQFKLAVQDEKRFFSFNCSGHTHYLFFTPLHSSDWHLAMDVPRTVMMQNYGSVYLSVFLFVIPFLGLLVLSILLILYSQVKKPLHGITSILRQYHPSEPVTFDNLKPYSTEYYEILQAFSLMDERLKQTYLELQHSKTELEDINRNLELRVQEKTRELAHSNTELEQKVHEIQQINMRLEDMNFYLKQAKQEAQEAAQARSEFIANVSHELRTPLNSIINFTDQIIEDFDEMIGDSNLQQEHLHYLQRVFHNGQHLLALINDLLLYSKADALKLEYETAPCNIAPILRSVHHDFSATVDQTQVEIILDCEPNLYTNVDILRFTQIMNNLVSNAVKFTTRGHITIRGFRQNTDVVVEVEDTGRGIPQEKLPIIFDPFQQLNRYDQGTGLGLGLVRKMCDVMKINIELDTQEGEGTTFRLVMAQVEEETKHHQ